MSASPAPAASAAGLASTGAAGGSRLLLVTRPAAQSAPWVQALQALGQPAEALPLLEIAPAPEPGAVVAAWQGLAGFSGVMFVSANAVAGFFAHRPPGAVWPRAVWAASTGPGTTAALQAAGVDAAAIVAPPPDSPQFDSEALWLQLQARCGPWPGRQVLLVRGGKGRDWLADTLRDAGAQVQFLVAYESRAPQPTAATLGRLQQALARPQQHVWLFSSSQAVAHLQQWAPQARWAASQAWVTHPRIGQAAQAAGFGTVVLLRPGLAALAGQLGLALPGAGADGSLEGGPDVGPDVVPEGGPYNLQPCE